jgi:hypothetical protein
VRWPDDEDPAWRRIAIDPSPTEQVHLDPQPRPCHRAQPTPPTSARYRRRSPVQVVQRSGTTRRGAIANRRAETSQMPAKRRFLGG